MMGRISEWQDEDVIETPISSHELETFTDERDGHVYKTVKIGDQLWMAENMVYTSTVRFMGRYYENDYKYSKYGGLYTWHEAMDTAPKGWHLPTAEEWFELIKYCGKNAVKLKSKSNWLKNIYEDDSNGTVHENNCNGTDDYGFNVLPAGYIGNRKSIGIGQCTLFWTSTQNTSTEAYVSVLLSRNSRVKRSIVNKDNYRCSVRCVKD